VAKELLDRIRVLIIFSSKNAGTEEQKRFRLKLNKKKLIF
jgi:hypothetical protein